MLFCHTVESGDGLFFSFVSEGHLFFFFFFISQGVDRLEDIGILDASDWVSFFFLVLAYVDLEPAPQDGRRLFIQRAAKVN